MCVCCVSFVFILAVQSVSALHSPRSAVVRVVLGMLAVDEDVVDASACKRERVCVSECACVCACVHVCVYACACVCACMRV